MMQSLKRVLIIVFVLIIANAETAVAQCAMCKVTLENNVSNGHIGIAENLNTGILYLFAMPYIAIGVVGYLWYKKSKLDEHYSGNS
jgi:hypothetical protein